MGQSTTILVRDLETPLSVIEKSLKKIHQTDGEPEISQNPHDYVLKVSSVGGKQCMIEPLINLQIAHLSIELFCGI
jgi:hypothetical protein